MKRQDSPEDKAISEFLYSVGPWNEHIVIGGGFALFIYKLYLADQDVNNKPVGTRDIDSIIPRKIPEICRKNIFQHLQEAGFHRIFIDHDTPAAESYLKEIDNIEIEIEFLTDALARHNKNANVRVSGIVAQPLSYLELSLQINMKFTTYSGATGRVVSPGAWIFHKGLTFVRRKSSSKMLKDLYGIWYVVTCLGTFSENALEEFFTLSQQHSQWYKTFKNNLNEWIKSASPNDWVQLETQDPSKKLKKLQFQKALHKLLSD